VGVNASTDGIAIDRKAAKAVCESFMIMFWTVDEKFESD
jgi:hypothetical protein